MSRSQQAPVRWDTVGPLTTTLGPCPTLLFICAVMCSVIPLPSTDKQADLEQYAEELCTRGADVLKETWVPLVRPGDTSNSSRRQQPFL